MNNFNFVASFYDILAELVFGTSIHNANICHLNEIAKTDEVLIIGGGTGKILNKVPECATITYIEKSWKMIKRSKRWKGTNQINFMNRDFFEFESDHRFNVIVYPFLLDCFSEENLKIAISKTVKFLDHGGKLIVIDFQPNHSKWLIRLMHVFFRILANLESKKLKDIHHFIQESCLQMEKEQFFHKNMIFSRVYRNL